MLLTSYEVEQARQESPNAIEVVHSDIAQEDGVDDLVYSQTADGAYQVDENALHEKPNASLHSGDANGTSKSGTREPPSSGGEII
jgi:hypothetical protein